MVQDQRRISADMNIFHLKLYTHQEVLMVEGWKNEKINTSFVHHLTLLGSASKEMFKHRIVCPMLQTAIKLLDHWKNLHSCFHAIEAYSYVRQDRWALHCSTHWLPLLSNSHSMLHRRDDTLFCGNEGILVVSLGALISIAGAVTHSSYKPILLLPCR